MHFPIFLKAGVALRRSLLNVESIIFWKLIREIEAAAICFVIERDPRKSQQNSRIRLRAQIFFFYYLFFALQTYIKCLQY